MANLHKETKKAFSDVITDLHNMTSHGRPTPMISKFHYNVIKNNAERLNSAIIYDRDFNYQYFGIKTLERSYLLKIGELYESFVRKRALVKYYQSQSKVINVLL